jgi:VWFA-related protein
VTLNTKSISLLWSRPASIFRIGSLRGILWAIVIILCLPFVPAHAQEKQNKVPPEESNDVIRVNTELVQTDVMVFDKGGRFVDGLRPEDFELSIDGKRQPISFFDRVTAGSRAEEAQLAAARGESAKKSPVGGGPVPLDRGRTVFFFIDDLHLAPNNLVTARKVLLHYLDKDMGQNDEAAITSASGQIGFLQQITDNKDVLRAAIARLKARGYFVSDLERPSMSEYQALAIERNNRDVLDYFVDELMKDMPSLPSIAVAQMGGLPRTRAEQRVRDRAHMILQQAATVTANMLFGLESLVRSAGKLPGRKLVFFVSDGFFLDNRNSDSLERLRHITSAAAHSGVVIYSIDARGLVTGLPDASSDVAADPSGRLQRAAGGELVESQDAMNALASDTGGRAIFNTNALEARVGKSLAETSAYYLLAWRPDNEAQKTEKFRRIEVSIIGRPELTVRVRGGFFSVDRPLAKQTKANDEIGGSASPEKSGDSRLHAAMLEPFPERGLPVSLSLTYVNSPDKGPMLTVALQLKAGAVSFTSMDGKQKAAVEIAGLVYNDEGKVGAHFNDHLSINGPATTVDGSGRDLIYNYPLTIPPGLYQVRVGVRDEKSGSIGSAQDWVQIPDLSKTPLALSSLIVSERLPKPPPLLSTDGATSVDQGSFSVDHRFQRNSFLRFLLFLYSAQRLETKPDIAVQVQVLRDNQPVITTSPRKVATEGIPDLTRLAYAAEISLEHLPAGRYVLQVTAIDRVAKTTATQRTRFQIE